ncbi:MAG: YihY/virulence factor BrkB family protein [Terriglobales bacterium]
MPYEVSPWKLGGLTKTELAKRTWGEIDRDDVFGRAAELSYYFFLAIWPGLFFLTSLLGMIAASGNLQNQLMNYVNQIAPGGSGELIKTTLQQIVQNHSAAKLWLGLIFALWTASSGMQTIGQLLDITYDVTEKRPYWKQRLNAIWLILAVSILMIVALVLVTYGPEIANFIFGQGAIGAAVTWTWKILQWPVAIFAVLVAFALMYAFAPDVEQDWHWVTPGSVIGVVLWLVASLGMRVYLNFSNSYSETYGALGTVIIMLLWLYITGAAILIGSEINSEIEHAAAERGHPRAKQQGEKAPGEKRAA